MGPAEVTNTIRWYDPSFNVKAAIAIGGGSLISGLYHDGYLYWITEETVSSVQAWSLENGAFTLVRAWVLPAGYTLPTAITGDGMDLYVACTFTDAGPPVSVTRVVVRFDKEGRMIDPSMTGASPTSVNVVDLDFNGQNLLMTLTGTASSPEFLYIDLPTGAIVYNSPTMVRTPVAMTFDGHHYPTAVLVAGFWFGIYIDQNGQFLSTVVVLPTEPHAACMVHGQESELGFESSFGAEAIAMAHRA